MKLTVLGSSGFIGGSLVSYLRKQGFSVFVPNIKNLNSLNDLFSDELGHVFYCIGLTSNFRSQPFDTVEAHVCLLKQILEYGKMESLTYLSSTRVYEGLTSTGEDVLLQCTPTNPSHLYNLSKLMGESLCVNSGKKTKIVRVSNVYGVDDKSNNFLTSILKDGTGNNSVEFLTSSDSSKDYISINDVVRFLPQIAIEGKYQIYNLASGENITNEQIAISLKQEGIEVRWTKNELKWSFPMIDVSRLEGEFGSVKNSVVSDLPHLLKYHRIKEKNE